MFDLNRAILDWRRRMSGGGVKQIEVLDELESHLREDVERQTRAGMGREEAFELAVKRLGEAAMLKAEFSGAKPAVARRVMRLVLSGSGLFYLCWGTYGLAAHELPAMAKCLGYPALGASVLCALGCWRAAQSVQAEPSIRTTMAGAALILAGAWVVGFVVLILPHFTFTVSELVDAMLWAMVPAFAAGGFAVGLEEPGLRPHSRAGA